MHSWNCFFFRLILSPKLHSTFLFVPPLFVSIFILVASGSDSVCLFFLNIFCSFSFIFRFLFVLCLCIFHYSIDSDNDSWSEPQKAQVGVWHATMDALDLLRCSLYDSCSFTWNGGVSLCARSVCAAPEACKCQYAYVCVFLWHEDVACFFLFFFSFCDDFTDTHPPLTFPPRGHAPNVAQQVF